MGKIPEMVSSPCHSARLMHFPSIQETQSIFVSSQERARNAGAERYLVGSKS